LNADTAPVNDPECGEAKPVSLLKIRLHDTFDIACRNSVQVEDVGDGNFNGFFIVFRHEWIP